MGQCLRISEWTFCLKMADSNAISSSTFSIFDARSALSRHRETFFRNYSCFKMNHLSNLIVQLDNLRCIVSEIFMK